MGTHPKISLCMIAKDEEVFIEQALESVAPILYEAIVIDTGSQDSTVEKAQKKGAKVFFHPWVNDFSVVRNFSISKALGDWILVLDADEAIASKDLPLLLKQCTDHSLCYEFLQRHYTNDVRISGFFPSEGAYPEWERKYAGYFESNLVRLFPNEPGLFYRGNIHELVEPTIYEQKRHQIVRSPIPIHHYGHTPEVKERKDKGKLYSSLGKEKVTQTPQDWKGFFELGVEHNNNGRLQESAQALMKSIELNPHYVHTWVNLGYVFMELGHFKEAVDALQSALKIDPQSFEAYCNLGVVCLRVFNFKEAERCFLSAIRLNPKYTNAWCNLARTYANCQRLSEAVQCYRRVLEMIPSFDLARKEMEMVYSFKV